MAKKTFRVRLYRIHDYDLYSLYFDPFFPLRQAFCLAVTAYAEGLQAPRFSVADVQDLAPGHPISISCSFSVQSDKAIMMLEAASAHGNCANNFVKLILRRSLVGIDRLFFNADIAKEKEKRKTVPSIKQPVENCVPVKIQKESALVVESISNTISEKPDGRIQEEMIPQNMAVTPSIPQPSDLHNHFLKEETVHDEGEHSDPDIFSFIDGLMDGF